MCSICICGCIPAEMVFDSVVRRFILADKLLRIMGLSLIHSIYSICCYYSIVNCDPIG